MALDAPPRPSKSPFHHGVHRAQLHNDYVANEFSHPFISAHNITHNPFIFALFYSTVTIFHVTSFSGTLIIILTRYAIQHLA